MRVPILFPKTTAVLEIAGSVVVFAITFLAAPPICLYLAEASIEWALLVGWLFGLLVLQAIIQLLQGAKTLIVTQDGKREA